MAKDETKETAAKFTKQQILQSNKFADFRDVFNIMLEDGKEYTMQEVQAIGDKFLKTPVNEYVN